MHQLQITSSLALVFVVGVLSFPTKPHHTYLNPKYYAFSYGVKDDGKGLDFSQDEKSDGNAVHGSYSVRLPDGRKQIVNYQANHYTGFWADVAYEGKAAFPPESDIIPPFIVSVRDENSSQKDEAESEISEESRQETTVQPLLSEKKDPRESMPLENFSIPLENVPFDANIITIEDIPSDTETSTVVQDVTIEARSPIPLEDVTSEGEYSISLEDVPLEAVNFIPLQNIPNEAGHSSPLENVSNETENFISLDELPTEAGMPMLLEDVIPNAENSTIFLEDVSHETVEDASLQAEDTVPSEDVALKQEESVLFEDNHPIMAITLPPIEANKVRSEETLLSYLHSAS